MPNTFIGGSNVNLALWLGPLSALGGVAVGGLLTFKGQDKAWLREETVRWRDARKSAYTEFSAAIRSYRSYASRSDAKIGIALHPDGKRIVPILAADGAEFKEATEATYAKLRFVAGGGEVVSHAEILLRMTRRWATARVL